MQEDVQMSCLRGLDYLHFQVHRLLNWCRIYKLKDEDCTWKVRVSQGLPISNYTLAQANLIANLRDKRKFGRYKEKRIRNCRMDEFLHGRCEGFWNFV